MKKYILLIIFIFLFKISNVSAAYSFTDGVHLDRILNEYRQQVNIPNTSSHSSPKADLIIFLTEDDFYILDGKSENSAFERGFEVIFNNNTVSGLKRMSVSSLHNTMIPSFAKAYYKESTKPIFTFTIRPSKDKSFSCYDKKENSCYVELAEKNTIS